MLFPVFERLLTQDFDVELAAVLSGLILSHTVIRGSVGWLRVDKVKFVATNRELHKFNFLSRMLNLKVVRSCNGDAVLCPAELHGFVFNRAVERDRLSLNNILRLPLCFHDRRL